MMDKRNYAMDRKLFDLWIEHKAMLIFHIADRAMLTAVLQSVTAENYVIHIEHMPESSVLSKKAVLWIDVQIK